MNPAIEREYAANALGIILVEGSYRGVVSLQKLRERMIDHLRDSLT
jgi:hypothetical protein